MSEEKSKTLIRFGLYMLFLLVVVCLIVSTGATRNDKHRSKDDKIVTQKTYLEKEKDLLTGTYKYVFTVDNDITFTGTAKDGIRTGKKVENDKTISYIEEDKVYKIENEEKIVYEDLYEGIDAGIFDFENLFDILNKEDCLIDRTEDETIYSYTDVLGYNIDITADKDYIIKIQIDGSRHYRLEFTY